MDSIVQPLMDFFKDNPYFSGFYYFGLFLLFITSTIFFFKFGLYPIFQGCVAIYNFFKAVHVSMGKISFIEKELRPNGGSTLKDTINSIKKDINDHSKYILKIDEKHRILLNSIGLGAKGIGFFETNQNGECISLTPKYSELAGLAEEELLGFNWILAIHPDDKDQVLEEWNSCTKMKRVFRMRYRYLNRKSGQITNIECTATPIRVNDEIVGFLGSVERVD